MTKQNTHTTLKVLDLFSGIGGFAYGLDKANYKGFGFETFAFCEVDPLCRKSLHQHWTEAQIFDDVRTLTPEHLSTKPDVICGGFPCQDISVCGDQAGLEGDTRSGLWSEYKRLIKELEPKYVIIENVANLRNLGLKRVLQDLWEIGYDAEWHIIPATSVGASHKRERIWITSYPTGFVCDTTIHEAAGLWDTERCKTLLPSWCGTGSFSSKSVEVWDSERRCTTFIESCIRRTNDGFPKWVDRIKQLGNSVVPQIPYVLGLGILRHYVTTLPNAPKSRKRQGKLPVVPKLNFKKGSLL